MKTNSPRPSTISTALVEFSLGRPSLSRRWARLARKSFLKVWNAPFRKDYFGRPLVFPGSHDLIQLTNDLNFFNTPLRRLAQAIRASEGGLRFVDIGANVGEGVPLIDLDPQDLIWLIEGSEVFLPFLRKNIEGCKNVTVFETYVSDQPSLQNGREVVEAGNAHITSGKGGTLSFDTLDRLFASIEQNPNLIKINVEGHEPRVLAGARQLIKRAQPIFFVEWHPRLLVREGFDGLGIFTLLEQAGYTHALIYDNHGFLFSELELSNRTQLTQLANYARCRDEFYFDCTVFAPAHDKFAERFSDHENEFYRERALS